MKIPIDQINVDQNFNSRRDFTHHSVTQLMGSIEQNGLIEPIAVRPFLEGDKKYDLIAGFRRLRACTMLGHTEIFAVVHNKTKDEAMFMNVEENINREQLSIAEEAEALGAIIERHPAMSERDLCKKLSVSRGWIQPRLMLLKMPKQVRDLAHTGHLNWTGLRQLNSHFDDPVQMADEIKRLQKEAQTNDLQGVHKKLIVRTVRKDKRNPATVPKQRKARECKAVLAYLEEQGYAGELFCRAIAWAGGTISDLEFCREIKRHDKNFEYDSDGFASAQDYIK